MQYTLRHLIRTATVACLLTLVIAAGEQSDGQQVTTQSLFENFSKPPAGYGNVPFYWWVGEPLTKEKLLWQLEELADASTSGFAVSYPHTHRDADVELNRQGSGGFGAPVPSSPAFRSKEWWELWAWFTQECAKRNIGVGLDDYVFNWQGNKQWPDEIAALPQLKQYKGSIKVGIHETLAAGDTITFDIDSDLVGLAAYPVKDGGRMDGSAMINLLPLARTGRVEWTAPAGDCDWRITRSQRGAGHLLHPDYGRLVTERYFQHCADHIPKEARAGMNYFFQDELHYPLKRDVWAEDFSEQFQKRKGYDLRPWLIALDNDIGSRTAKIRLDYWDVVMDLAEERYFKPIGEWHLSRGFIYGCDNNGRGRDPVAYGDYFRATSWFGAPGNDAPGHGLALIQTKVSSSIAHLYRRPRVWLEAYHSMGWGASPSFMHESLQRHYVLGANLLCLHGLYYSTFGGWFEWAPPDFHFRMPYWPHMKLWLRGAERMSYLMSQGVHRCDVALLYPTEPLQTGQGNTLAFAVAESLFHAGLDFDFVDSRSVSRMDIEDGQLQVAGECYRALILAGMSSVHFSTLQKALSFFRAGGTVVVVGDIPHCSDRVGSDDPQLSALLEEILGKDARPGSVNRNAAGGVGLVLKSSAKAPDVVSKYIERDFIAKPVRGKTVSLRSGKNDFMVLYENVKQLAAARGAHPIDKRTRSAIVFVKTSANSIAPFYPLAMKWFTQPGRLEYEPQNTAKAGCYRFVAPPGLHRMRFWAYGEVDCWVDGKPVTVTFKGIGADGLTSFEIALESPVQHQSVVAMRIAFQAGRIAGAVFEDPIAIDCGRGRTQLGDWGKIGVLEHYSGAMRYRRTFALSKAQCQGKVKLDMGRVNATCEVHVNGRQAGICLVPPYKLDISKFVRAGVNKLEILVYGTLANHYQTIPTPAHYRRPTPAGLIGPAQLVVERP